MPKFKSAFRVTHRFARPLSVDFGSLAADQFRTLPGSQASGAQPIGRLNLIMPEPCDFISRELPRRAIVRPTGRGQIDAIGAITGFIADGLFIGQKKEFVQLLLNMAAEADEARRGL